MRPQDIVILLKIAARKNEPWYMKDLAYQLGISASEVTESLNRSVLAGLLAADKRTLMRNALLEFLIHGLKYVFPQKPGAMVRGMATAHSAFPLNQLISSEEQYVWTWADGEERGFAVEALHPNVPKACRRDSRLYEILALVDALRLGKIRGKNLAIEELQKRL
jgi:hypothetical protein